MALSVICAGYGRTGTTSLKLALEQIGFAPCYKWAEAARAASQWLRAFEDPSTYWPEVFDPYRSALDFPACLFFRELCNAYPNAKFVLTLRNSSSWFSSAQETYLSPQHLHALRQTAIWPLQEKILAAAFGEHLHDRDSVIAHYERHNRDVERFVPQERLLIYNLEHGWDELCAFLDVPVPNSPFPHLNSRDEWKAFGFWNNPERREDGVSK